MGLPQMRILQMGTPSIEIPQMEIPQMKIPQIVIPQMRISQMAIPHFKKSKEERIAEITSHQWSQCQLAFPSQMMLSLMGKPRKKYPKQQLTK